MYKQGRLFFPCGFLGLIVVVDETSYLCLLAIKEFCNWIQIFTTELLVSLRLKQQIVIFLICVNIIQRRIQLIKLSDWTYERILKETILVLSLKFLLKIQTRHAIIQILREERIRISI